MYFTLRCVRTEYCNEGLQQCTSSTEKGWMDKLFFIDIVASSSADHPLTLPVVPVHARIPVPGPFLVCQSLLDVHNFPCSPSMLVCDEPTFKGVRGEVGGQIRRRVDTDLRLVLPPKTQRRSPTWHFVMPENWFSTRPRRPPNLPRVSTARNRLRLPGTHGAEIKLRCFRRGERRIRHDFSICFSGKQVRALVHMQTL